MMQLRKGEVGRQRRQRKQQQQKPKHSLFYFVDFQFGSKRTTIRLPLSLPSLLKSNVFFFIFFFSCFFHGIHGDIRFDTCFNTGDFGGNEKNGTIFNGCIIDHTFNDEHHAWVLTLSKVINTNFTRCSFSDSVSITQSFHSTTWRDVNFQHCVFSGIINFDDVNFERVTFENCTFSHDSHLHFNAFTLTDVTFQHSNFYGIVTMNSGEIIKLTFEQCTFGARHQRSTDTNDAINHLTSSFSSKLQRGDIHFQKLTALKLNFEQCRGDANFISFAFARIFDFNVHQSVFGSVQCEQNGVDMEHLVWDQVSFTYGINCTSASLEQLYVKDLYFDGVFNLSDSFLSYPVFHNISSSSSSSSSSSKSHSTLQGLLLLNHSTILRGAQFQNLSVPHFSLAHAHVLPPARLETTDFDWNTASFVNLTKTVFGTLYINTHCCTTLCTKRSCLCNDTVAAFSTAADNNNKNECPEINSTTRWSDTPESETICFPGISKLQVGVQKSMELKAVEIGTHAYPLELGPVYFFAHATANEYSTYIFLTVKSTFSSSSSSPSSFSSIVRISPLHYLHVFNNVSNMSFLKTARDIRIGDLVTFVHHHHRFGQNQYILATVTKITKKLVKGRYAPVTMSGNMIVDGVLVSCFTEIMNPTTGTAMLAPMRALYRSGRTGKLILTALHRLVEGKGDVILDGGMKLRKAVLMKVHVRSLIDPGSKVSYTTIKH